MKKFVVIVLTILCLCIIPLTACSNDQFVHYNLESVSVNDSDGNIVRYTLDEFNNTFPNRITDLGKKLSIKNDNEIIFTGEQTKDIDGKVKIYDAGLITYVSFENNAFNKLYDRIEIYKDKLFVVGYSELIDNESSYCIFEFVKEN